jgi:hypothetical protein
MGYHPRHASGRKLSRTGLAVSVAGLAVFAGTVIGGSTPAMAAAPTVPKINNTINGEAGYFVNDNGGTRIRDVQATTVITNTMEDLNGSNLADPGGVGVELCNDNTGDAAQLGLEWNGTQFEMEYGYTPHFADLTAPAASATNPDPDPCAEGGLLNGGTGIAFANPFIPQLGDTIHFEVYYNPGKHHSLKFEVQDVTQNITRVQTVKVPAQDYYEAGIGVLTDTQNLTGGAVNLINTFTGTEFNWYGNKGAAPATIYSPSHWDLELADFVNGSNQVTLTPGPLNTAGTSFEMLEGSTSA